MYHNESVALATPLMKVVIVRDVDQLSRNGAVQGLVIRTPSTRRQTIRAHQRKVLQLSLGIVTGGIGTVHGGGPLLPQQRVTMHANGRQWGAHDLVLAHGASGEPSVTKSNKSLAHTRIRPSSHSC